MRLPIHAYFTSRSPLTGGCALVADPQTSHSTPTPVVCWQISCFRMTVLTWLLAVVSLKCAKPLRTWLQTVHDTVRDESYLLGQQLQNYTSLPSPAPPATTPAPARVGS
jgi:hypothetical protein